MRKRLERAAIAVASTAVLVGLLSLPAVRALASDFLGLFRVEKIVAVDVDPDRVETLMSSMQTRAILGEPEVVQEADDPVTVKTVAEASDRVGFTVGTPAGYPEPTRIVVSGAGAARFSPDFTALRDLLEAVEADPGLLPDSLDGESIEVMIPAHVELTYEAGDRGAWGEFYVYQMRSPTVEGLEEADFEALGRVWLELLGLDGQDAARLSGEIDWTSTLVLPVPAGVGQAQETEVAGAPALFVKSVGDADRAQALLWQRDGIITLVAGNGSGESDLLAIGNSIR